MQSRPGQFKHARLIRFWLSGLLAIFALPAIADQSVTLAWNPSTSTDIVGYNIYYGTAYGVYTNVVSAGTATNLTISGLLEGTSYYFAATAVNSVGQESSYSNQTFYVVPGGPPPPQLVLPVYIGGWFVFWVNGVSGSNYVVLASTNLVDWTPLETNTSPFNFIDQNASQFNQRFYRAVYSPP